MDKGKFRELVRDNLNKELQRRHMSQAQFLIKCEQLGYHLTQPELSKLLSGKAPVTLYQVTAFAKVFGTSVEQLVTGREGTERILNIHGKAFITDPQDEAYNGYMGTYYALLHSTSPFEANWLSGKLTFSPSDGLNEFCSAIFELDTGERDKRDQSIIKRYKGELIISRWLGAAYCLLLNESIGELSIIQFRHRNFFVKQVECRMGLVLTTSAGESKLPTAEKIFLSRERLSEKEYSQIQPYLKFTEEELVIAGKDLEKLASSFTDIEFTTLKEEGRATEYFLLDERTLRGKGVSVNRQERAQLIREVRERAVAPWLYCISEREDSLVYETEKGIRSKKD